MINKIYLDNNATTPLNKQVKDNIYNLPDLPYNPSSTHIFGKNARKIIEESRSKIKKSIGIDNDNDWQLIFTSSGTEANNLLISNFTEDNIIISTIEHESIDAPANNGKNIYKIDVDQSGMIDIEKLDQVLKNIKGKILVSIIYANNETGVIQDLKSIASVIRKYDAIFHIDAVQAFGKINLNIKDIDVDMLTISSHKIGGPVGSACIIYKNHIYLKPQILGGGQERGIRSGTENVLAIYGFSVATDIIKNSYFDNMKHIETMRNKIEDEITKFAHDAIIVSKDQNRLPNTSMIIMPGVKNIIQMMEFDSANIAISSGSACSSGKIKTARTLIAMKQNDADSSIRISLGIDNNINEIEYFIIKWKEIYNRLKKQG